MIFQIVSFLLDVAIGLVGGACLLRAYMQWLRVGFAHPVGQAVFALSDWVVLPLRRWIPAWKRLDTASAVAAMLLELAQFGVLWLLTGQSAHPVSVLVLAAVGFVRLIVSGLVALIVVNAVMSWVQPGGAARSPVGYVLAALVDPLLKPLRRWIPLLGGVDFSPLVALVILQVATMVVGGLQQAVLMSI
jgi:YggT family protein